MLSLVVALSLGGVEVAPGTPCVSAQAFAQRLSAAGVMLKPSAVVRLEPSGRDVVLARYVSKDATLERRVPAPANDCEAVTRVLVALVQAWASPGLVEPARPTRDGGSSVASRADGDAGLSSREERETESVGLVFLSSQDAGGVVRTARDGGFPRAGSGDSGTGNRAEQETESVGLVFLSLQDAGDAVRTPRDGGTPRAGTGSADAGANNREERETESVGLVFLSPKDAGAEVRTARDGTGPETSMTSSDAGARNQPTGDGAGAGGANGTQAVMLVGQDAGAARVGARDDRTKAEPFAARTSSDSSDATTRNPRERDAGIDVSNAGSARELAKGALAVDGGAGPNDPASVDEPPKWTFGAGLLGGVASGATSQVLPAGQLVVDVVRGWFGVAVDVGLSGPATGSRDGGSASSSWQWASASARLAIPVRERLLLEAQLGVRGYRIQASARNFELVDPGQVLFSVGATGSVGASFRVLGPVGLSLRLTGNTRRAESFFISQLGPVLETGTLEGSVLAGLVARF